MTYTIELSLEEEKIVDRRASRLGVTPQDYVRHSLGRPLRSGRSSALRLTDDEGRALSQMNARLPLSFWERYAELTNSLRNQTLTEAEHTELSRLAAQEEAWTGERLPLLQPMAQKRNASLLHFMKHNGIGHHPDALLVSPSPTPHVQNDNPHPLARFAGALSGNPLAEDLQAAMGQYRQVVEADPNYL